MFAIIPHKDCLFFLASAAREIIRSSTPEGCGKCLFSPLYPLWAFTESVPENILSLSVLPPESDGDKLFFPLKLSCMDSDLMLRIDFALCMPGTEGKKFPCVAPEILAKFPLVQRSFREGLVVMENRGWKLYDEKWHKCC